MDGKLRDLEGLLQVYGSLSPSENVSRGVLRGQIMDHARDCGPEILIALLGAARAAQTLHVEVEECKRQLRLLGGDI